MPIFRIITTTVSFLEVDLSREEDQELFEDAVGEDGEIDLEALAAIINDEVTDAHSEWNVIADFTTTVAERPVPNEEKALRELP